MNAVETINKRHSYRGKYLSKQVPKEDLIKILEAGMAAPPVCETAPAIIVVLTQRINAYRDRCFAVQDYSAAIENMLLTIAELGYQSCWYEGHITDEDRICDKIADILLVPKDYEVVCILPVGVAESEPLVPKKKVFEERAWFNTFKG